MARMRIVILCFLLGALVVLLPMQLIAGGKWQEKIQQRINAPKNVQFQQYEPYYLREGSESLSSAPTDKEQQYAPYSKETEKKKAEVTKVASHISEPSVPILSSYAIYRTDYKAEIEEDVVTVKGNVLFEVFKKGWVQVPLVRTSVGLIDATVNRSSSFINMQGDRYYLMIDRPGRYELDIEFLIKATRERENGPGSFNFEVIPAPISQFEFTMPESGVEIFVEPSIKTELTKEPKKTVAWAVMPNTNSITVRWTKALPKEVITPVKIEPKVYVDTSTYAAIGEGIIRCQTTMNYSILQSEVSNFRIALPEDASVLEVKGKDLRDWKVSQEQGTQYLDVYLSFGVKGNYILQLNYERKIGEGSVVADMPWVRAMAVEREKGYFGVAAATNVELAVNKAEHVTLIDVKELPSAIWSSTTNPILLAFKYLNHPFSIAIDVTRHEELPVLVAAIDSANYVTLQTDEGKCLTKAIYQMRNNVKQFIHLGLPPNATLWSVFVAGKPVKPAKDKNGDILVPLEKSQLSGESLTQFPVEIVYLDKNSKMGLLGNLRLNLPQTDIPVSQLNWSTYFPLDYLYFNFGGDVKLIGGTGISGGIVRSLQGRMKQVAYESLGEQFTTTQDFYNDMETARMKGVLPIKIDIPEQGRLYRFSKLLVTEKESPRLSVSFLTMFRPVRGLLKLFVFVAIVFLIGRSIKKRFLKKSV